MLQLMLRIYSQVLQTGMAFQSLQVLCAQASDVGIAEIQSFLHVVTSLIGMRNIRQIFNAGNRGSVILHRTKDSFPRSI